MIILPRAHHVKEPLLALTLALHGVLLGLFDVGPGRAHLQTQHDRRQGAESDPLHCTRFWSPISDEVLAEIIQHLLLVTHVAL